MIDAGLSAVSVWTTPTDEYAPEAYANGQILYSGVHYAAVGFDRALTRQVVWGTGRSRAESIVDARVWLASAMDAARTDEPRVSAEVQKLEVHPITAYQYALIEDGCTCWKTIKEAA